MAIFFYKQKDETYKWFKRPLTLLAVFDIVSYLSYRLLFIDPNFDFVNSALTFTLTLTITGFTFVLLYNDSPEKFRKRSFSSVLLSVIIAFPTFLYLFLNSYFPIPLGEPIEIYIGPTLFLLSVPLIIALNFGVFLFYLSIGIYQWKISQEIWKAGWWVWNLLPIINFLVIYQVFTGINVYTNAVNILGFDLTGGLIITLIICSLFYLPVIYTLIKEHFFQILVIFWAESLMLIFWVSQNLFINNIILISLSFFLFGLVALMPILYKLNYWKTTSILWMLLTFLNVSFFFVLLTTIGIILPIVISIDIFMAGFLVLIFSYFPHLKAKTSQIIVIISYFTIITGIFLTILFFLLPITENIIFSINLALIIMTFSLYSSKYLKFDESQKVIHIFIYWLLIFNFAWLTFNTFSLIPGLELFAFFLSITVFGGFFYVFNQYKMENPINKGIPWMIMSLGMGSSIASIFFIFLHVSPLILIAIFITVNLFFTYFVLDEHGSILWFLFPVPLALITLDALLLIEVIQNILTLSLVEAILFICILGSMLYFLFFQIILNIFNFLLSDEKVQVRKSLMLYFEDEDKIKAINFTCFVLNSTYLSLFIAWISPVLLFYQILEFLIIWSILILLTLNYLKKSDLEYTYKGIPDYLNILSIIFYLLLPSSISIILFPIFIEFGVEIYLIVLYSGLFIGGFIFLEANFLDKYYFECLKERTNSILTYWSWFISSNVLCTYLYLLHLNLWLLLLSISIVNLVSIYFLDQIESKKQSRNEQIASKSKTPLIINSAIMFCFFISSFIALLITTLIQELSGIPTSVLFLLNSVLLLFLLSYFFNKKMKKELKFIIELILFVLFQFLLVYYLLLLLIIYNSLSLFTMSSVIVLETLLSFVTANYICEIFLESKDVDIIHKIHSSLITIIYFEISFLFFALFVDVLGVFLSTFLAICVLLVIILLDLYSFDIIPEKTIYNLNWIVFFIFSLFIFILLNQLLIISVDLLWLNIVIFLALQFYTVYVLFSALELFDRYDEEKLEKKKGNIHNALLNSIFVIICFYGATSINSLVLLLNEQLVGTHSIFLIIMLFSLFMFILNYLLNQTINPNLKNKILLGLFLVFQVSFAIFWGGLVQFFSFISIGPIITYMSLILIAESVFTLYPLYAFGELLKDEKYANFKSNSYTFIVFILYLEFSLLFYGLFENFLISQIVLFLITIMEIYIFEQLKRGNAYFIHTISYFNISIALFLTLFQFIPLYPDLLYLNILVLICMQFYTNNSIYNTRFERFFDKKKETEEPEEFLKQNQIIQHLIGALTYFFFIVYIQRNLTLLQLGLFEQVLLISLLTHVIMIIDQVYLKFMGRFAIQFQFLSWFSIMIFSSLYLSLLFTFSLVVTPAIILVLVLELLYLLKLANFTKFIKKYKERIIFYLIIVLYMDFITWPVYYSQFEPFLLVNLLLFSFIILLIITYVDEIFEVFSRKARNNLNSIAILVIGSLISLDIFLGLQFIIQPNISNFTTELNLCIASLVFVLFVTGVVKPFYIHSKVALLFWILIFSLFSLIIYFASYSEISSLIFFAATVLLYPFVFLLEELRELFNKFVDYIHKKLIAFKEAFLRFYNKVKVALVNVYKKIVIFLKKYYKIIWGCFSVIMAFVVGYLLFTYAFDAIKGWGGVASLSAATGGLLYFGVLPAEETDDPDELFKRKMWKNIGISIGLFLFLVGGFQLYNIYFVLIYLLSIGTVMLPWIIQKEKKDDISVKYRFYLTLFLIITFIITVILLGLLVTDMLVLV